MPRCTVPSTRLVLAALLVSVPLTVAACGDGSDGGADEHALAADLSAAVAAVEEERGGPQEYFEVTALPTLTNVFVAIDGATAAVPYVYRDRRLEPPGPTLEGASGNTFRAASIDVDEERVLTRVLAELPDATIESLSVEGSPGAGVRYVVSARSSEGGLLEIVVTRDGGIVSVDPV